ncbi:tetratricopeptide repeat protein [Longispora sp. K20-0274]|uniref:AfsR/SARP family transcriptional regulator n=1 Tax=Longispora sp. K20-0274 TaxID=3088255 RepID=UPI00399BF0BA
MITGRRLIGLLGPVVLLDPPTDLPRLDRYLLGLLAARPGWLLPTEDIIDALWPDAPPNSVRNRVQAVVSALRRRLPAGAIETRSGGYLLAAGALDTDVADFERLSAGHSAAELRAALDLWRGPAYQDVPLAAVGAEARRLTELRLDTTERLIDLRLRRAEHRAVLPELQALLAAHPTRQRLRGQLMLALHRSGRQDEALECFRHGAAELAEEHGLDPAPELRALHDRILRADPDLAVHAPAAPLAFPGLPPAVHPFVGRDAELAHLADPAAAPQVTVITGPGGIGKSSLALTWAHRAADHYGDGRLFLTLAGEGPEEILDRVLRAAGIRSAGPPAERAERYWGLLRGRRVLVVLDNADNAEQVAGLVPPDGGSTLLVTARDRLAGLALRYDTRVVELDVLGDAEAATLIGSVLRDDRPAAEPAELRELAALCGGYPLALRMVAATLVAHPRRSLRSQVAELAEESHRLAALGPTDNLRAVFASVYRPLTAPAARAFRLLGGLDGVRFDAHLAAAVTGLPLAGARAALGELRAVHLVTEGPDGRHGMHDLVRLYAREVSATEDTDADRAAAFGRLLDWFLTIGHATNTALRPQRDRVPGPPPLDPAGLPEGCRSAPATFVAGELPNLVPALRRAVAEGRDLWAWQVTYLLGPAVSLAGDLAAELEVTTMALPAVCRLGDPAAEALVRNNLAAGCSEAGRLDEALTHLAASRELAERTGDEEGLAYGLQHLGIVHTLRGDPAAAVDAFTRSLAAFERLPGAHPGQALSNLGHALLELGEFDAALEHFERALVQHAKVDYERGEAATLDSIGEVHLRRGDPGTALDYFERALAASTRIGHTRSTAISQGHLGEAYLMLGEPARAAAEFTEALDLHERTGNDHLAATTQRQLAEAHLAAGEPARAADHLARAHDLRVRTPDQAEQLLLAALRTRLADHEPAGD